VHGAGCFDFRHPPTASAGISWHTNYGDRTKPTSAGDGELSALLGSSWPPVPIQDNAGAQRDASGWAVGDERDEAV